MTNILALISGVVIVFFYARFIINNPVRLSEDLPWLIMLSITVGVRLSLVIDDMRKKNVDTSFRGRLL